uniref:ZAD domain-containing protein n=1 Tax=Heliothis virescens TaxID=7102 RepID=A0A2A4K4V1_HELVI
MSKMDRMLNSKKDKQTIYEIYRACRLCGAGAGYKMPIIQNVVDSDDTDVELKQKIRECVQIEVHQDDKMPPLICELCVDKVNDFYEFLEMCRQTNKRTRLRLGLPPQSMPRGAPDAGECILGLTEPVYVNDDSDGEPVARHKRGKVMQSKVLIKKEPDLKSKEKRSSSDGRPSRKSRRSPTPPRITRHRNNSKDDNVSLSRLQDKSKSPKSTPKSILKKEIKSEDNSLLTPRLKRSRDKEPVKLDTPVKKVKISAKSPPPKPSPKTSPRSHRSIKQKTPPKRPPSPVPQHQCSICGHALKTVQAVSNHMKQHGVTFTSPRLACNPCGLWFPSADEAAAHHRQHRSKGRPYTCTRCATNFKHLAGYDEHFSNNQCIPFEEVPDVKCPVCWHLFPTNNLLDTHKCMGEDYRPGGKCPKCKRNYTILKNLKKHELVCTAKKKGEVVIDPELLGRLRPAQVRISRCDPLLTNIKQEHYDVSTVSYDFGLDKNCIYPYISSVSSLRIKSEPGLDKMVSIKDEIKDEFYSEENYIHWDSDESSDDDITCTSVLEPSIKKKKVDTLANLTLKIIFSQKCLGRVPRKRRRVKAEKNAFDSLLNETEDDVTRDINNIIDNLGDDEDFGDDKNESANLSTGLSDKVGGEENCMDVRDDKSTTEHKGDDKIVGDDETGGDDKMGGNDKTGGDDKPGVNDEMNADDKIDGDDQTNGDEKTAGDDKIETADDKTGPSDEAMETSDDKITPSDDITVDDDKIGSSDVKMAASDDLSKVVDENNDSAVVESIDKESVVNKDIENTSDDKVAEIDNLGRVVDKNDQINAQSNLSEAVASDVTKVSTEEKDVNSVVTNNDNVCNENGSNNNLSSINVNNEDLPRLEDKAVNNGTINNIEIDKNSAVLSKNDVDTKINDDLLPEVSKDENQNDGNDLNDDVSLKNDVDDSKNDFESQDSNSIGTLNESLLNDNTQSDIVSENDKESIDKINIDTSDNATSLPENSSETDEHKSQINEFSIDNFNRDSKITNNKNDVQTDVNTDYKNAISVIVNNETNKNVNDSEEMDDSKLMAALDAEIGTITLIKAVNIKIDGLIDLGPNWSYEYKILSPGRTVGRNDAKGKDGSTDEEGYRPQQRVDPVERERMQQDEDRLTKIEERLRKQAAELRKTLHGSHKAKGTHNKHKKKKHDTPAEKHEVKSEKHERKTHKKKDTRSGEKHKTDDDFEKLKAETNEDQDAEKKPEKIKSEATPKRVTFSSQSDDSSVLIDSEETTTQKENTRFDMYDFTTPKKAKKKPIDPYEPTPEKEKFKANSKENHGPVNNDAASFVDETPGAVDDPTKHKQSNNTLNISRNLNGTQTVSTTDVVTTIRTGEIYDSGTHKIRDDVKVNDFTNHLYKQTLKVFDVVKEKTSQYHVKKQIDELARSYEEKFKEFLADTRSQKIKTRLGTQKVILNTIDMSNRILNRLINFMIGDMDKKGVLRQNVATANIFQKEIEKEQNLELGHACKKFGICRSGKGFPDYITGILTTLLRCDDKKFKQSVDSLTEVMKNMKFHHVLESQTSRKIKESVEKIERLPVSVLRPMVMILKNIITHKNKPLIVETLSASHRVNSTLAFLEIIDLLDQKMPRDEAHALEWIDIENSLKGFADNKRYDVQEIMEVIIKTLKKILKGLDKESQKIVSKNLDIIFG